MRFLSSPAPWVAIATMVVAMIPHIVWLADAHFVPLTYAGDTYSLEDSGQVHQLVTGYALHNVALLALPGQTLDSIDRVYSHAQALVQADAFLRSRPWEVMTTYNTAGAARSIADTSSCTRIGFET